MKKQRSKATYWCDLTCKYARFPEKLCDGSKTCRTFVALYCKKFKKLVYKNKECAYYAEWKEKNKPI